MLGLDRRLILVLFAGVLVGFVVNYGFFTVFEPPKSWHRVADFILANSNMAGLRIIYNQSNVYNGSGPWFEVKGDLWRISWQTVKYYGLLYALPSVFIIDTPFVFGAGSQVLGSIQLLKPAEYWDGFSASLYSEPSGNLTAYYPQNGAYDTSVVGYPTVLTGTGKFFISALEATGCFEFTIDDYY